MKDRLIEVLDKIADYAYDKYLKAESRYFKIIFEQFEKKIRKGCKTFNCIENKMHYVGNYFEIIVKKSDNIKENNE